MEIMDPTPESYFGQGSYLASRGQYRDAIAAYGRALELRPSYAEALNNRGLALAALRDYAAALTDYDAAIACRPEYARALNNRGLALAGLGRYADAIESYERALVLQSDYLAALINCADGLAALQRRDEALQKLDQALALSPSGAALLHHIGLSLASLGKHQEALSSFDAAIKDRPQYADAWLARARSLLRLARLDEALESATRALATDASPPEALDCQGLALQGLGRHEEAVRVWDRFLTGQTKSAEAYCNRGASLRALARFEEALQSFGRALELEPNRPEVYYNRAILLDAIGEKQRAVGDCDRALERQPDYLLALHLRAMILLSLDRFEEAQSSLRLAIGIAESQACPRVSVGVLRAAELFARAVCCEWHGFADSVRTLANAVERGEPTLPFLFICFSDDPGLQRRCAETADWNQEPVAEPPIWPVARYRHERIRIAYICGEFCDHPVARLTAGLFECHDRTRFEVTGVSLASRRNADEMTVRLERAFDRFIDAGRLSTEQIARQLRELEIDIAIDLNGYTGVQRFEIFARRCAPVQVGYIAYPGTTGSPHIDYLLADEIVIPREARRHYSEQVVYLPGSFLITDDREAPGGPTPTRAELGLPDDAPVFCAFNNSYKITPALFDVWMRLLRSVPGSVLWLRPRDPIVRRNLQLAAQEAEVCPERLVFAPPVHRSEHIGRLRQADLVLDTAPYGGHSTAIDVLLAGVPIVTLMGDTFAARVCASVLTAAGLPELVTHSVQEYESLALRLAIDPYALATLRRKIAGTARSSALFDTDRSRRHIEAAYHRMWERHQTGGVPVSFSIQPDGATLLEGYA
jgi:predicted O-linked N-acetylglucosamine transferase (SPINDLY family)